MRRAQENNSNVFLKVIFKYLSINTMNTILQAHLHIPNDKKGPGIMNLSYDTGL